MSGLLEKVQLSFYSDHAQTLFIDVLDLWDKESAIKKIVCLLSSVFCCLCGLEWYARQSCWSIHTKFRMPVSFGDWFLITHSVFHFILFILILFLAFLSCWLIHTKFRMQVSFGYRYLILHSGFQYFFLLFFSLFFLRVCRLSGKKWYASQSWWSSIDSYQISHASFFCW